VAEALSRAKERISPLGSIVLYYPVTGSTNDVAAALAGEQPDCEGAVVVADEQTKGRGRRGRDWFSPPGSGLYVSIVLAPGRARHQPTRATLLLTLAAGVALAEGVQSASGLSVDLKWPNDLYIGAENLEASWLRASLRRPVRGHFWATASIMTATAYPPDIRDRATSLEAEAGRPVDAASAAGRDACRDGQSLPRLLDGRFDAILDAWRRRAPASIGARVGWSGPSGPASGLTAGIDDDGALLVDVGGRIERIVAGQLTWF
jgi:BirA family biotin operon repressor/biotin-[acetyl-CoA-carboxylase] ligase